ncbi:flagellar protein FlaG [Metasolibacillus fluoroglycofenilyticus]|uniref:flagellar protein FlaG n=1 Tax=Metasolibacillus fluoroglycofenilyticus TaxID=1239396 RepID=UPI000D39A419|nr:flagellar protein FlaG [Metasolibacillus fluoroglycofenilyticus]
MRIGTQGDVAIQTTKLPTASNKIDVPKVEVQKNTVTENAIKKPVVQSQSTEEQKDVVSKDKLQEAVDSINEFLQIQHKASKFVYHEGLDKYYVQLVDTDTEEVIKEIPPEQILNAFYELKKLAGMIVDEKI